MAYKTFTNGSVLPASDLNTYLMNQSVMTFVSAAARDAVLTAPTEGMTSYLEDTNQVSVYTGASWELITSESVPLSTVTTAGDLIIADGASSVTRLGIGTVGQVLSSDGSTASWEDPVSGGMVVIASGNFSTSASVLNLTSISQGYKDLRLVIRNMSTVATEEIRFRLNNDSSGLYGEGFNKPGTATFGKLTDQDVFASYSDGLFIMDIVDYSNSSTAKLVSTVFTAQMNADPDFNARRVENFYRSTDAVDEINIFGQAGTNDFAGGSYILYGVN
jgi:hypothetical protein